MNSETAAARWRPLAFFLALTSGAAALGHQLLWTRRLVDVLGASSGTFSKVIGAFFLGLALGTWLGGRASGGSFWKRVAFAEWAVAFFALPMLFAPSLADRLYQLVGLGAWMKLLLPLLLITPATIGMGLVTTWMVRALLGTHGAKSKHVIWLYAANTLGGVVGIGALVLEILPRVGLAAASGAVIALNVVVGLGAFFLARFEHVTAEQPTVLATSNASLSRPEALLAFSSGFFVLALEVVLQHHLAQVTINSLFSSAIVLALVLIGLSAAALLFSILTRYVPNDRSLLRWTLIGTAFLCAGQPLLFTSLRAGVSILPYELLPLPYTWEVAKLGLLAVCPLFLGAGLVFPLLLQRVANRNGGRSVGVLFAWNGVGGFLGAELTLSWIAPKFGLWGSMVFLSALYAALFIATTTLKADGSKSSPMLRWAQATLPLAAVLAAAWFCLRLSQATLASGERLAALTVGREGVVATVECGPDDWRMLFNNSYTLGGSKAQFNQERQGLLPLLLHAQPKSVAALGVATGGTVAGAALDTRVEHIDAIELSPLVLKYADQFFTPYNRDVFRDRRVRFIAEDARWIVSGQPAAYDVVLGDLFLPWRTGEGRLFTLEHFQNVQRSLKLGGIFCQWLPLFQLTRPQFDLIVRTFSHVFPHAFLVRGDFYSELPIIGLVGGMELSQVDWKRIMTTCAELRARGEVTDPLMRHVEGVAMLMIGPVPASVRGTVNTLANAALEWDAGRNILGMRTPWFIGVPCAEYVRDAHRAGVSLLPPEVRAAHDAGQFFLTLEIAAKLNLPALADLQAQVPERMPPVLRADERADWQQWPMRLKPRW